MLAEGANGCRDPLQKLVVALLEGRLSWEHGGGDDGLEDMASEDGEGGCRVDVVSLDCLLFVEHGQMKEERGDV